MNKLIIFIIISFLLIVYGCSHNPITFKEGVKRINEIDSEFDSSMKTLPDSIEDIEELTIQLTGFAVLNNDMPQSLKYILDYRIKTLEAEKLFTEGWQWGRGSTIDWGFGCRGGSARILNSSKIRNSSAYKGYEALDVLQLFVDEFPKEAKSVNLSQKDVLFSNAAYYKIEKKAGRDSRIIRNACKEQIKELNITI